MIDASGNGGVFCCKLGISIIRTVIAHQIFIDYSKKNVIKICIFEIKN